MEHNEAIRRIEKALDIAEMGGIDGAHHKQFVIDQIVRALTGCSIEQRRGIDCYGRLYEYEIMVPNDEYSTWVMAYCAGEDGPETYSWDCGVAP